MAKQRLLCRMLKSVDNNPPLVLAMMFVVFPFQTKFTAILYTNVRSYAHIITGVYAQHIVILYIDIPQTFLYVPLCFGKLNVQRLLHWLN